MIKKDKVIDAHLSGMIAERELRRIKQKYDSQIEALERQLNRDAVPQCGVNRELILSILHGETDSTAYFSVLLESMHLQKNGLLEVKLNHLPIKWRYQLT